MTTATARRALSTGAPLARPRMHRFGIRTIASLVGAGALLVSLTGAWIPSLWGDEAVSIMSAQRSLPSLFAMLGRIDAVHGAYYLFLHGWISVFGTSELSVRSPSIIGVGIAAAGTVILGNLLFGRRIGIVAGVVLAVLPRVTYAGVEARSYALGIAVAVWLTVLLVVLISRGSVGRRAWFGYAIVLAAAIYLFLYLFLLVFVHGVALLATTRSRGILRRWLWGVGIAVGLAAPVLVWGIAQHHQISFLRSRYQVDLSTVFASQWFNDSWLPVLCWGLIALGIASVVRPVLTAGRRAGLSQVLSPGAVGTDSMGAPLAIAWLVLPTAILLVGNAVTIPMYATRYLTFCTPAVALLIAAGIAVLPRIWMQASTIALLIALVVPGFLVQRGPYAMDGGSDWRQISSIVGAHAQAGDAIVFGLASRPSRMPRLAMRAYAFDYRGLNNVELATPFFASPGLRDEAAPLRTVTARLVGSTTVWAVDPLPGTRSDTTKDVAALEHLGFHLVHEYPVHRNGVYELIRDTP
ncbi:MAG: glycosyltransferase family 39 protein [Terrimesophilobacter sp.]